MTVQYSFWDWAATSTKRNTKIVTETPDGQSGPDLFETGFRLERIQDTADGRYAVLKDDAGKRIYLKNNDTPLPLDPAGWENLDPDPAVTSEEGTEEEGAGEEVPATETKPDKPPKPRRSGGGLFGGDDR